MCVIKVQDDTVCEVQDKGWHSVCVVKVQDNTVCVVQDKGWHNLL